MVLSNGEINIIADMEGTTGVKLHNNRQKLRARFDIIKKLGQGTYGKVQLAINKDTGEEVAIKTIKKSKIETEQDLIRIQREIQIMSSVQHPHIIHIYEVFENREKIVLVMEYASGGELYDFLSFKKVLEEPEARRVFRQVASAVFYCHQNMICHRDLKLENILLDEKGSAKIADFGLSNVFDERHFLSTFCGSPLYASPEIVRGTPYYGPEVDCWSLGVLLYTLVYGAMPFDGSNFKKLVRQISEGDYYEPKVPSEASSLIRRMLTVDPAKRANIDDICCDIWVDLGEDVPLFDIAKDMCKQMPVRLDYLLALTATAPHPPSDLPLPPESAETRDVEGNENRDQWERTAEGMDTEMAEGESSERKHKLEPSSSSLADSSAKLSSRKKKKPHSEENDDDEDGDGAAEKIVEVPNKVSDEDVDNRRESSEENESKQTREEEKHEEAVGTCTDLTNESAVAVSKVDTTTEETDLEKNSTTRNEQNGSLVKRKPLAVKKAVTSSAVSKLKTNTGVETNAKTGVPSTENGTRVSRLRKSLSIGREGNGNSTPSSPVGSPDKRKVSLTSSRINDAKKAFEAKALTEKKPLGIAGAKVSSVRKAFESPPTTPEATKMMKSPLSRKNSSAPEESKADEDRENVPAGDGKKPLVRQGSKKGVTRNTSPTKTMKTPLSSGQHHNGCVPHEAKVAAALAAQDAKKSSSTSPPKTVQRKSPPTLGSSSGETSLTRKNSLSKTPSLSKSTSGSVARRSSAIGTPCRTTTTRPRSPVKTIRPPVSVQKPKVVEENVRDVAPRDGDEEPLSKSVETSLPTVELDEPQQAIEITKPVDETKEEQKETIEEGSERVLVEKRGSIEIAPLSPSSSLACRRKQMEDIDDEDLSPQIRFIPRDQGQFTLLGVTSEVVFDVGAEVPPQEDASADDLNRKPSEPAATASSKPESKKKDAKDEDPNKIIRYVATVRRHGSEDNDPETKGPERVTLLNIRRSETGMNVGPESPDSGVDPCDVSNPQTPEIWNTQSSKTKQISKTPDGIIEEKKSEVEQTSVNTEQRGYNVYRSKYRSVQKYRSVVEKRDGDGNVESGAAFTEEPSSLERSDSFSSTGSNDDLEDVFENLTSESLFTSLLSRTRHLMDRLTDGDTYASRWFQSGLLGRRSLGLTSPTSLFDAPNVSFVRNPINTASNWRNYGASSRDYHPADVSYVVEGGGSGNRVQRWRYSRSSTRNGDEEEDPAFMSDSTGSASRLRSGNLRLRARASFNAHTEAGGYNNGYGSTSTPFISSRSTLSGGGGGQALRQSRYDTFRGQDVDFPLTRREEARSDIISALLHHRNRSLDGRRPHSFYDESDEPWSSTSSSAGSQSRTRSGQEEEKSSSLYGTMRRPQQRDDLHSKSVTKEEEKSNDVASGLRRPRSVLVLSDPNQEDSVSVSRDYSKSVSKTGNTKKEEEEEYEREHRIIEDEAGRSVTTTRRECKRSVSRSDDDKSCSSSVHVHTSSSSLRRPIKKQPSDEDPGLSRQDSGIGSLYDSTSVPSTPLSVGSQGRRGILKFARTVSNELESLEEEISRIGMQHLSQQQETTGKQNGDESSEGRQRNVSQSEGIATDGTTTPASDSAETGSVCSDGAGTETSSSTVKASEEESVGERIRRKSFFARFNETSRIPRKGRKSSSGGSPSSSSASLRSELNRSSSLRHRHVFDDDGLGGFIGGRMHYDPAADFYSSSSRLPHRWSMHLGNGGGLSDSEFLPYDTSPHSPRRGSLQSGGGAADVLNFLRRPECGSAGGSWIDDGSSSFEMPSSGRSTSPMSRTRSLPEEGNPPSMAGRPVLRQHSMPSNSTGVPPPSPARRPSHLGLYSRNISQPAVPFEESGELSSPETPSNCSGFRSSRRPTSSSSTGNPRMTSSASSLGDPLDGFETNAHRRPAVGTTLASLMDSLDSPSEVLQKAMDLCDSLRYT